MLRSRTVQGSLAASTAVACVLSLASPATGAAGGFGGLLHDQVRCCSPVAAGEGIASGVERPAVRPDAGGRASAAPVPGARGAPGWTDGWTDGSTERGLALAQTSGAQGPDDVPDEVPDRAGTRSHEDGPEADRPRALPLPGPDATDRTFEGSAKPAGPDLTLPEEEQLITGGWN